MQGIPWSCTSHGLTTTTSGHEARTACLHADHRSRAQAIVDPVAMHRFENVGKSGRRNAPPDLHSVSIRAATRVEVLVLSRYDYSRLLWNYNATHTNVKASMIAPPSRSEVAQLVRSSAEWEKCVPLRGIGTAPALHYSVATGRYKQSILTDVVVQNKRKKFKPFARGHIPTHRSVNEAAATATAGSPDVDSPEHKLRLRQQRRDMLVARKRRRAEKLALAEAAEAADASLHQTAKGTGRVKGKAKGRGLGKATKGGSLPTAHVSASHGLLAHRHTNAHASSPNGFLGVTAAGGHVARRHSGASDSDTARLTHRSSRARPERRRSRSRSRSRTRRPSDRASVAGSGASGRKTARSRPSVPTVSYDAGAMLAPPQWHVTHEGGYGYGEVWERRQAALGHTESPTGGRQVSVNTGSVQPAPVATTRTRGRAQFHSPIASRSATVLPGVGTEKAATKGRRRKSPGKRTSPDRRSRSTMGRYEGFRSNPVSPRAQLPSSQHVALPAMTKAHMQGYLEENVAVSNRWGCLRVSPLIEARMMQRMGLQSLTQPSFSDESDDSDDGGKATDMFDAAQRSRGARARRGDEKSQRAIRNRMKFHAAAVKCSPTARRKGASKVLAAMVHGAAKSMQKKVVVARPHRYLHGVPNAAPSPKLPRQGQW